MASECPENSEMSSKNLFPGQFRTIKLRFRIRVSVRVILSLLFFKLIFLVAGFRSLKSEVQIGVENFKIRVLILRDLK